MKVVLNQDVKGIGKKLQIVEVSEGYARNFLLPKKLASLANSKTLNEANTKKEAIDFKRKQDLEKATDLKTKIEKTYIEFRHKVGEGSKLFGSITEKEISEKVQEKFGIKIDKKKISLKMPIKNLGEFSANIKLYEGVVANLKIVVVRL